MALRNIADLEKNYSDHFYRVREMDSIDKISLVPEPVLVFFILRNYLLALDRQDTNYWKDDFSQPDFSFKIELLKKILNYISTIDESLAIALFETIDVVEYAAENARELSLEDEHFLPFGLRCQVVSYLESQFSREHGDQLDQYVYSNWPKEPTLVNLEAQVKTRPIIAPSESSRPMFDSLTFRDSDCENVGLFKLSKAFLAKLWFHGASDKILKSFLDESKKVEQFQFIELFKKYGNVRLSKKTIHAYEKLIAERLEAQKYFPNDSYLPGILTFAPKDLEKFLNYSETLGIHVVPIKPDKGIELSAKLRAAARMDADILLFQGNFELDAPSVEIARNLYLTGHSLAFSETCSDQVLRVIESVRELQQEPKVFKLPAKR